MFNLTEIINKELDVKITSNKSELIVFDKDNPIEPRVASDFEIRDTNKKSFYFPQVIQPHAGEGFQARDVRNIIEQVIILESTLDAEIRIRFGVADAAVADGFGIPLYEVDLWYMPEGASFRKRAILTPEKGALVPDTANGPRTFELPELRQPYPSFVITVQAQEQPTTGAIRFLNIRRY